MRIGQKIQAVSRQADLNRLQVVAGILCGRDGHVLIAERLGDGPFHGMWEFPGGKIAAGESAGAALARELREEIGISLRASEHFMSLEHSYPDRHVAIDFYLVTAWENAPVGLEGQELRWLPIEELPNAPLLPADEPVVNALSLMAADGALFMGRNPRPA
jgi:8-oxo-dGTP diphosphatase